MYSASDRSPTAEPATTQDAAEQPRGAMTPHGLAVIDELMAGGEMLPAQMPKAGIWSPEKKLAAAVLASALVEIRDHCGTRSHRRSVVEALEWVAADDGDWPFSFVRLCALFDLEPEWVRGEVRAWIATPPGQRKSVPFLYRQAA